MRPTDSRRMCAASTVLAVLACIGCSSSDDGGSSGGANAGEPPVYPPSASSFDEPAKGIELLNTYRAAAGLAPVQVNNESPYACEAHLDYLIWEAENNGKGTCYLSHTEPNHNNPYYSADNEQAGKDSVIACGFSSFGQQSLGEAVDLWINSLYHRLPLLNPGLTTVGYAAKKGWSCINYRSGTGTDKAASVVVWPPDRMEDVPLTFVGYESPCPTLPANPTGSSGSDCQASGFIVTATWANWASSGHTIFDGSVPVIRLVEDATGAEVPLLAYYADGVADHDPAAHYVKDTFALVPKDSLTANTKYRVEFSGTLAGEAGELRTTFTTGKRKD